LYGKSGPFGYISNGWTYGIASQPELRFGLSE
jgi:hypothetical protein